MRLPHRARPPLVYLAAAMLFTWPLVLHPIRMLAANSGPGDPYLNLWIIGWDLRTLFSHPAAFLNGDVFNAPIFHPAPGTLTYSDNFLLQSLVAAPLYAITRQPALCYNAIFFISLIGAAWAMHVTMKRLAESDWAAWTAGLAWGFAPYHFGHLSHIQLQAFLFLPLAFLYLHRVFLTGRPRDSIRLGAMAGLQAIASVYYGVMSAVALVVATIVLWVRAGWRATPRLARQGAIAAVVAGALVAPIAYPYLHVQQREGFGRSLAEATQGSAELRGYITAPEMNLLYGVTGLLRPAPGSLRKPAEQMLFCGFALMALAAVALWRVRARDDRALVLTLAAVGLAGLLLSLGPEGIRPLYALAHKTFFGFQAIRAPARFAVLVLFALAGLAGLAVREIARTRPRLAMAAIALIALEYVNAPIAYVPAPVMDTAAGAWLRDAPERGAVFYHPLASDPAAASSVMIEALQHGRPIVNGYSGQRPSFFAGLLQTMTQFPSLETIKALDDLGVAFVVSAAPIALGDLPLAERARFDDRVIYEVRWSPEATAALAQREARPLPPIVSLPFGVGETAAYSITWTTGPIALPAGKATFRVVEGQHGDKFKLTLAATTASWVSRFFEADDRFESSVSSTLLPSVFEQRLREGARKVDRRMVFDHVAGSVRLDQGGVPGITVPAQPDSLDPVSALYYLRTVTLTPGQTVSLPVVDWGRNLTVSALPGAVESISVNGQTVAAQRIAPRVARRDGQAELYQITVWISTDPRRIPLLMTIDGLAGVGSVRLELESYTAAHQ